MTAADQSYSRRWLILAVVGVAQMIVVLDTTVVNIGLPSAPRALHFSDGERQWVRHRLRAGVREPAPAGLADRRYVRP
jgi:hypothetical protein